MIARQGELREILDHGLQQLRVDMPAPQRDGLLDYLALLLKWNRRYNLTAVRAPREMVTRHLLDCLAVVPYVQGPRLLDVGSGAGLPGIPLALALPDCRVMMVDASGKKTRFITQAIATLGISNAGVEQVRVEDYRPSPLPDTVIARAFAPLDEMLSLLRPLCRPGGRLLAMQGRSLASGAQQQVAEDRCCQEYALAVPGLQAARHLLVVETGSSSL